MKTLIACVLATSVAFGLSPDLRAQETYPNKIIRLVVPYSAGGTGDQIGRLVGDKLGELLGQRVLIDNKGGAGGNIGAEATVRSPADGYTLVMAATSLASNPALLKKMSFDPVKDLVPVSQCCGVPMVVVVNPALPIRKTGGYRRSGLGRLHGFDALIDFTEIKHIYQNAGVVPV